MGVGTYLEKHERRTFGVAKNVVKGFRGVLSPVPACALPFQYTSLPPLNPRLDSGLVGAGMRYRNDLVGRWSPQGEFGHNGRPGVNRGRRGDCRAIGQRVFVI